MSEPDGAGGVVETAPRAPAQQGTKGMWVRRILLWIAGILVLLVAGVVVAVLTIDWTDKAESAASAAIGREVRIGSLDIDPGWTTTAHLADVEVANTDWGSSDALFALEEGSVSIRVWPLIKGQMEIPEIVLTRPVIALETNAEGQTNWNVGDGAETAGEAVEPDERSEVPLIGRLIIEDGKLSYRDPTRDLDLQGKIETAKADAAGEDALNLSLDGTLENRPLELTFVGGSVLQLRETEKPYPVDVDLRFGQTRVRADGTITDPVQLAGLDISFAVEGPTLADVFPIFQIPLPDTPPYSLAGDLAREGETWRFQSFEGKVGDSDLAGSLSLDQGQTPPLLNGDLVSKKLDFADLAGLVGADPSDAPKPEEEQFPNAPIAADRLDAMNMDVSFKGTEVIAPNLPLDRVEFRVQVDNGRAEARPLSFALADGTVSGEIALNARQEVPSADAALRFENLDIKPFFKDTRFVQEMGGRFSGSIYVLGVGQTPKEMMETARGEGAVAMRDGSISGLIIEAAGLDVAEALALVVGEDARVPIRCGRIKLDVQEGTVNINEAVVDTTDSLLVAQGNIRPAAQTFNMQIEARAKDFSLIDVAAPVSLSGSFSDPSIAIGGIDPLPFFETGDQQDIDCDKLVSGALEGQFKTGQEN
ncbi:MAG: AsmA family protein [Rhodospirillales bacterium]|nr:AsmA family protein [Rhodospirillales bacterium]